MKSLIKLFLLSVVVIVIVLYLWGGFFWEKLGSYVLDTEVSIGRAKFIPQKLIFELYGINLPCKNILIPAGSIYLIPPKLEFYGLKYADKIILSERNFSGSIFWHNNWQAGILFKGVRLDKFGHGFKNGYANGSLDGVYTDSNFEFYGLIHLEKIVYSDTDSAFLGMTSSEFQKLIDMHNGILELDFIYRGPLEKIDELYRYKPGKKTMALVKDYLLQKLTR